jgi:hypothetical protein
VAKVQELLNAFVFERYLIWRDNYVTTTDTVCGAGTARIKTDPPKTVSEGQGYGMAISAAIGDKPTFDALWNSSGTSCRNLRRSTVAGSWAGCGTAASLAGRSIRPAIRQSQAAVATRTAPSMATWTSASAWCTRPCSGPSDYKQFAIDWLTRWSARSTPSTTGSGTTRRRATPGQELPELSQLNPVPTLPGTPARVIWTTIPPAISGSSVTSWLPSWAARQQAANGQTHHDFWYKTAETVYQMLERCYDQRD